MAGNYKDEDEAALALRQIEDLELKQKRMAALVEQRRHERAKMELEVARLERMKKHMQAMCEENKEVAAAELKRVEAEVARKAPFQGVGFRLADDAPKSVNIVDDRPIVPAPPPVEVDPSRPVTNIQVRSSDGSRLVVQMNQDHTIRDLKQQILSRQETREGRTCFVLISAGPPPKPLVDDNQTLKDAGICGAAVLQRFK